jgi:uncharacterized membrane protein YgdD (TMEM256/DUF423 family)
MQKIILLIASVSGAVSVMLGAFGAHAFKATLEASGRLETYETAVKYQFYHTIALLLIGVLMTRLESRSLDYAAIAMIVGIIIFSGSLYILCMTGIKWLGAITPIGGVAMIVGWVLLFLAVYRGLQ